MQAQGCARRHGCRSYRDRRETGSGSPCPIMSNQPWKLTPALARRPKRSFPAEPILQSIRRLGRCRHRSGALSSERPIESAIIAGDLGARVEGEDLAQGYAEVLRRFSSAGGRGGHGVGGPHPASSKQIPKSPLPSGRIFPKRIPDMTVPSSDHAAGLEDTA